MIELDSGNVLLKPSHRRQLMSRLKRAIRLGERLGRFVMKITLHRVGRHVEMIAKVRDRFGEFVSRSRATDIIHALRMMVTDVGRQLHAQSLQRMAMARG